MNRRRVRVRREDGGSGLVLEDKGGQGWMIIVAVVDRR